MKHFVNVAKLILYLIIGGCLAFIVMFTSSYLKASSIAGDIARNGLLLATQEGCLNANTANEFCHNMAQGYGTKNILIKTHPRDTKEIDNTVNFYGTAQADLDGDGIWSPFVEGDNYARYGLIWVGDADGNSIINTAGNDYVNHVQRGDIITVSATVEVNMFINFQMKSNTTSNNIRFAFPVTEEVTGISCKWFKGED